MGRGPVLVGARYLSQSNVNSLVKIIPPKEWLEEHSAIDRDKLSLIQANPAIEQQFYGNGSFLILLFSCIYTNH